MAYKNSFYNHFFELDGHEYVYNILSTGILEINQTIKKSLQSSSFDNLSIDEIDTLLEEGYIIFEDTNEAEKYEFFYNNIRFSDGAHKLQIMFIPTYSCNLRCPYCYEGQNKSTKVITRATVEKMLLFVNKQIEANKATTPIDCIGISLYGGEPLLAKKELIHFCDGILDIAKKNKLRTIFDMTTNFVLLDDEIIELIKKCNISVQVSIDGPKEEHDIRRIRIDKSGTYDAIVKNLKKVNDVGLKDNITIRINVDSYNIDKIEGVFSEMIQYSNDVYFGILTKYENFNDGYKCDFLNENSLADTFVTKLNSLYTKYSLTFPQRFGKKSPCSLNSLNKWVIDYNLDVYKCEMVINNSSNAVGKIDKDGNFIPNDRYYSQMSFSPFKFEHCKTCKLLPLCGAGCPAKTFINQKEQTKRLVDCYNCDYTEESLTVLLKDYVKNNL